MGGGRFFVVVAFPKAATTAWLHVTGLIFLERVHYEDKNQKAA